MNYNPNLCSHCISSEEGFTLIELLVALAVAVMIFTFGYSGLKTALRNWEQSNDTMVRQEEYFLTRQFLQDTLESAHLFPSDRSQRVLVYPWVGEADKLIFSAPLSANGANNALYRIKLWFQHNEQALKIAWVSDANEIFDPSDETRYSEAILLRRIEAVTFSYLEWPAQGGTQRWVPRWQRQGGLPAAVKLDIKFYNESRQSWPSLVAVPRVTTTRACEFDPVSRSCRVSR